MTKRASLLWVAVLALGASRSLAQGHEGVHWSYRGEGGPGSWGTLAPEYATCASGRSQSPVDIGKTSPVQRSAFPAAQLRIGHTEHVADTINNGHTIQVTYTQGDTLTVGDTGYELAQYHFHAPSEHTVAGKHFPMEMHLVHKSAAGAVAVVGVLIEEGASNAAFDPVWSTLPRKTGAESHLEHVKVNVDDLLPRTRAVWRYEGSLTTPPCSEGVQWLVMTTPVRISAAQIAAFTAIVEPNNRPVQPLHGRVVATDRVPETPFR
jgi:carbonic anhydrase